MTSGAVDMNIAKSIFGRAQELDALPERIAYLSQACGADAALRAEVERLLAAADEAGDFMDGPAVGLVATALMPPVSEGPGTVIGPYKLMEQIGEGGFGLVFVAEQHRPVRRKVALKIIKPGMDTRDVIARFEAERQALALMDHPNIAKVFDAGATDSGRPYFVMELVRGIPITAYCDQHHLTPRERLELFLALCHAIQHAHQKGIIHRDVKPTNVLVTLHDGRPVAKVIDFGVAKALSRQLTDRTIYTQFAQMIGTPLYMSPEQAEMSGLDIDTRSDIYSLGVLLYELLTGTTPFDRQRLGHAAAIEIRRILCEEDPPKPSTRLSQSGDQLPSIAALRSIEPAKLSKLLRGDLDWIVMKCLEKDRNRRYETANGLARDIERYLHDEAVLACPPSAIYRFGKFARRNKVALTTSMFVVIALALGTVVSTWQAIRATYATRAEREARQNLALALTAAKTSEQAAVESAKKARSEFIRADNYFLNARTIVDRMAERLQEPELLKIPKVAEIREILLQDLLNFYQQIAKYDRVDADAIQKKARALRMVGDIQGMLGERALAERAYTEAIVLLEHQVAQYPKELDQQQYLATCHAHLGNVLRETKRFDEAEQAYRRALVLWAQLAVDRPINATYMQSLIKFHKVLFNLLDQNGQRDAAQALCGQLLAPFEKLAADSPNDVELQIRLGDACVWAGKLLEDTGRHEEAEQACDRALELYARLPTAVPASSESGNIARRYYDKGRLLAERERVQEAERAYRQAIAFHENPWFRAVVQFSLGKLLSGQPDRLADAELAYRESLKLYQQMLDRTPTEPAFRRGVAQCINYLSVLLNRAGGSQEADKLLREAIARWEDQLIEYEPKNAEVYNNLAWFLATWPLAESRDPQRAIELASKAVELEPDGGHCWNTLGVAQYQAGDYKSAIEALTKSVDLRQGGDSMDWFFLAMAEWQLGNRDAARAWYEKAVEWMEQNSPIDEELIRFRAEAAELLGLLQPPNGQSAPAAGQPATAAIDKLPSTDD